MLKRKGNDCYHESQILTSNRMNILLAFEKLNSHNK